MRKLVICSVLLVTGAVAQGCSTTPSYEATTLRLEDSVVRFTCELPWNDGHIWKDKAGTQVSFGGETACILAKELLYSDWDQEELPASGMTKDFQIELDDGTVLSGKMNRDSYWFDAESKCLVEQELKAGVLSDHFTQALIKAVNGS